MKFLVEVGVSFQNKQGEELCGDKVVSAKTPESHIAVLSDGLGSGVKANILSTLTAKIAATMLERGASIEDVVDTVSRTLPVCKVRRVAYSTFTIIQVFDDGSVYLAEFGNPATFYLHRGKIHQFPASKRVIAGKEIREARFAAKEGDILVTVSDGVVHAGVGVSLNLGWQWENVARFLERTSDPEESAEELANRLSEIVSELYSDRPGDDATVVVLKVRKPRRLTVAVGPPVDTADDGKMAQMLVASKGVKVICGGTTSKLIARELNRQLQVELTNFDPAVPPMGRIEGIDLVSEGMITLSRVLEVLKEGGDLDGNGNAVQLLTRAFLNTDEIHFLVGRAKNPAYQNTSLPYDLSLKQQVIGELASVLSARGKEVRCTYF